jgi:hypothetical protein
MQEYSKIQTVFKRDTEQKRNPIIVGDYTCPEFEYLKDNQWTWTEKVDGTNIRICPNLYGSEIIYGGKTDNAQIPAHLVTRLNQLFLPLVATFGEVFDTTQVCLYGEGYGAKIQKGGGNYGPEADFVLFDVKVGDWMLRRADVEDVATKLGLSTVPIIGRGTIDEMVDMVRNGITSEWGNFPAEGIVARPATELCMRDGSRIITKLKTRDFKVLEQCQAS